MRISIEIDTATLTDQDRAILHGLAGPTFVGGFRPATSVAHPGAPIDLSEGRAKEVPCMHFTDSSGVCKRCGEQVETSVEPVRGATDEEREAETLTEEKPKRKRRTKAEMEAARRQEEAVAEANRLNAEAETAQEQGEAGAPEPEQADPWTEGQPEPEAVSDDPAPATDQSGEKDPKDPANLTPKTIEKWREEAVAQATAAVAEGRRSAVKAALDAVGAKRVGELRDDQLAAFLGALKS